MTSTFARSRSDLIELRGQMASVTGLAPIRPGLKDRLLELLCIHGLKMVTAEGENTELPARGQALTRWTQFLRGDAQAGPAITR